MMIDENKNGGFGDNIPEFSVSELSGAVKRTVEGAFSHVRLRGEISRFTRAASGHLYMSLKDDKAVIDAVCWKGKAMRLATKPEEGLEVIVTGRLTTYPSRSNYQIIIEEMELAGEGALLKQLEERKKRLAAEGLFAKERKQAIPFIPETIGVVTSPTGAVIRDILHRLQDRFPRKVVLWPVLVQGRGAATQIARAIKGFNEGDGEVFTRPDVIIVARGGGSLEDLMAFNEEIVVRAAAASDIPLISAVGHETDTMLIDYASDLRAPTPTAAAEMAVPVRLELVEMLVQYGLRMGHSLRRMVTEQQVRVTALERGLGDPRHILEPKNQQLDGVVEKLSWRMRALLENKTQNLSRVSAGLRRPETVINAEKERLNGVAENLLWRVKTYLGDKEQSLKQVEAGLRRPEALIETNRVRLENFARRLDMAVNSKIRAVGESLPALAKLLESYHYQNVLDRGFALVRDDSGHIVKKGAGLKIGDGVEIEFADNNRRNAVISGDKGRVIKKKKARKVVDSGEQGSLF